MRRFAAIQILLWMVTVAAWSAGRGGVQVLSSSANDMVVTFTPEQWRVDTLTVAGAVYHRFSFAGSEIFGEPGSPQQPSRSFVLGLPADGSAAVQIVEAPFVVRTGLRVLPVGFMDEEEGFGKISYHEKAEHYKNAEYASPVHLSTPEFFRDQKIARLVFTPLQTGENGAQIRQYQRIVVRITFSGAQVHTVRSFPTGAGEEVYRNLLLNYDQARAWRQVSASRAAKTAAPAFAGDNWYKIIIKGNGTGGMDGIYRVTPSALSKAGVPVSTLDPRTIRLFNNGGYELPKNISTARPDALMEHAILVAGEEDGRFDESDYILFYGRSLESFSYNSGDGKLHHYINHYGYENVYWLTFGDTQGKRMSARSAAPGGGTPESSFKDLAWSEEEKNNIYKSGSDWLGFELARDKNVYTAVFSLPGVKVDEPAQFRFQLAATTSGSHQFRMNANGNLIGALTMSGSSGNGYITRIGEYSATGALMDGNNQIGLEYTISSDVSQAYVDWIEVEYRRRFEAVNDNLIFYGPVRSGTIEYLVSKFNRDDISLFDVTDYQDVTQLTNAEISSRTIRFSDAGSASAPRRYLAVTPASYRSVSEIRKDSVSDLRQARDVDYIIITYDGFYQQALQLESLREDWNPDDRLNTEVVKVSDIYDEFSWGLLDPAAIRDFLAHAYREWGKPGYVLLLGDGHYDYRNLYKSGAPNLILPYESDETSKILTRTTDDWFTYTLGSSNKMQMAIGRLPVRSVEEAQVVVDKLITYETKTEAGEWRKTITVVADDELTSGGKGEELEHTWQSEQLSEYHVPSLLHVHKIYLMEYPAVRTASISGVTKPLANEAIINRINEGTLLFNFIGHGADELLTHENVLNLASDLEKIQNQNRYMVWVAATCEFAYWDLPQKQSFAEELLNIAGRGAIGMVSSARLVYSVENADFNYQLFDNLFANYETTGKTARLGDAVMLAKRVSSASQVNNEKFVLLGDPAMRLRAPQFRASVASISPSDTLQALTRIRVSGTIQKEGANWNGFNGQLMMRVFDARKPRQYETEGGRKIDYVLSGNTIFRGATQGSDGQFQVDFIVPKDISYGGVDGRISLYFHNAEGDGTGYMTNLKVGGSAQDLIDREGPQIAVHFGNPSFQSGDYTTQNPVLHVVISDSVSGVNIAGDIGHQIVMTLDEEEGKNITEFFQYQSGSYSQGELLYPLAGLTPGLHTLGIKAWDNSNNSSYAEVTFQVVAETGLTLRNVLNYPNPMSDRTQFTFEVSRDADVEIQLFSVAGRLLRKFPAMSAMTGFNVYPEVWDGSDGDGDLVANGVYLFRVHAKSRGEDGTQEADLIGKAVVAR